MAAGRGERYRIPFATALELHYVGRRRAARSSTPTARPHRRRARAHRPERGRDDDGRARCRCRPGRTGSRRTDRGRRRSAAVSRARRRGSHRDGDHAARRRHPRDRRADRRCCGMNAYDLGGRVALVTGGASGLGRATADRLARVLGARVAVLDRDSADDDHFRERRRHRCGRRSIGRSARSSSARPDRRARALRRGRGAVGVGVRAGRRTSGGASLTSTSPAAISSAAACLPGMGERGYGRAVLVSSIAGKEGHPLLAAYASAKAGVIALVKSLGARARRYRRADQRRHAWGVRHADGARADARADRADDDRRAARATW